MRIERGAGKFKAESWSEGSPMWTKLSYGDRVILASICPTELEDLEYTIRRMREAIIAVRPSDMKPR